MEASRRRLPHCIKIVADPHHGGFNQWCYWKSDYWHRSEDQSKWTPVKNIHPTPKRIAALATFGGTNV